MITETFGSLLRDRAHWEFEIFLMLLFDGLIAGLLFPFARKHWKHHIARDEQDAYTAFSGTPYVRPDPGTVTPTSEDGTNSSSSSLGWWYTRETPRKPLTTD